MTTTRSAVPSRSATALSRTPGSCRSRSVRLSTRTVPAESQRRRLSLSPSRLRADPWPELARMQEQPQDVVQARAGRTRIAYLKGPEAIDDLLVRRADSLIKVNTITAPRFRRERFASLGRLLNS